MAFELRKDLPASHVLGPDDPLGDSVLDGREALKAHLAMETWPDGSARETSTLMLCWGEGRFRACLNDRAGQRSVWVSNLTLEACLDALERGLQTDSLEWRKMKQYGKRR